MTLIEILASRNVRKATMIVCGLGLLVVAAATKASAEANCPQWSTPVCTHWNLGPPPSCSAWACAADRQSDPPKKLALAVSNPVRPPIVRPPVVRPPVMKPPVTTTGPVTKGTGAGTPVLLARQSFSGMGGHGRR